MARGEINRLRPILTIKLDSIATSGDVGENVTITTKIKLPDSHEIKLGPGARNAWLYQRPVDRDISNVDFEVEIIEKDPQIPDSSGKRTFTFHIGATKLPDKGPKKTEGYVVPITADDGHLGKRHATFTLYLKWWLTTNANDLVNYIKEEIERNEVSKIAQLIKDLNKEEEQNAQGIAEIFKLFSKDLTKNKIKNMNKLLAMIYFANMVMPGHDWDHKVEINSDQTGHKCGEWSLDAQKGQWFHFDLWSNFHFGYIGRVLGFSEDTLNKGASIAQAGSDLRDNIDKTYREFENILIDIHNKSYGKAVQKMLEISNDANRVVQTIDRIMNVKKLEDLDKADRVKIRAGIKLYEDIKKGNATLDEVRILRAIRSIENDPSPSPPLKTEAPEGIPWKEFIVEDNKFY